MGSIAVVASNGRLVAGYGDPYCVTYLRSTAKPFQALPLIESSAPVNYGLSSSEIALICSSHSGTDEHIAVLQSLQEKTGILEKDLLCGIHDPYDAPTVEIMRQRGDLPTSNRHNCSGKHTGMLVLAQFQGWSKTQYIDPGHPVQKLILKTFSEMSDVQSEEIQVGIDGCSAPNFAVPLVNCALGYARLCDPLMLSTERARACRSIVQAMIMNPMMVAGPERFDTILMQVAAGRIISKGGAEGYQGLGVLPNAIHPGSPALGIALKISDGDPHSRARPAVALEVLRQLNALTDGDLELLAKFGPYLPVKNWREIEVGQARPCFEMVRNMEN
jgi:L-asparaginase II